jgi:agmatine deiminase
MPPEWAPHERSIMCWPARTEVWGPRFAQAEADYAAVANAIAAFEPVLMVADPSRAQEARRLCGAGVDVIELPLDDSWVRDSGPIFVLEADGSRSGVQFGFNGWGGKYVPYDDDARLATRLLERLGERCRDASHLVLEGGSIAVDGEGTLVTTEQCLLEEHRNPSLSREEIEAELRRQLGAERVVWLGLGLIEDRDTDGHVDNICAFVAPGEVVLQTVSDEANPNFEPAQENLRRLRDAGLAVVELPWLPYLEGEERPVVVPYTNFYLCNGAIIVPTCGADTDEEALAVLAGLYPGREAVAVPGALLAVGGGGVHCITQQLPAGPTRPGGPSTPAS